MEKDLVDLEAEALVTLREKCLKQNAQTADKTAKFLLNHEKTDQYIAEHAIQNTKSFN